MRKNEKTPIGEATPIRVKTKDTSEVSSVVINDTMQRKSIASYLKQGAENAIPTNILMQWTGYSDVRAFRAAIQAERQHTVILSKRTGGGGYFLPSDGEKGKLEIEAYLKVSSAAAKSIYRSISAARKELKRIDGQTIINDQLPNDKESGYGQSV